MQVDLEDKREISAAYVATVIAQDIAINALIASLRDAGCMNADAFRNALQEGIQQPETPSELRQHELMMHKLNSYAAIAGSKDPL